MGKRNLMREAFLAGWESAMTYAPQDFPSPEDLNKLFEHWMLERMIEQHKKLEAVLAERKREMDVEYTTANPAEMHRAIMRNLYLQGDPPIMEVSRLEVEASAHPTCNEERKRRGLVYPRTCQECGLGPCKYQAIDRKARGLDVDGR